MATKKLSTSGLNLNQEAFCNYYLSDEIKGNGTQAYMKAYPDCSEEGARRCASELLTNLDVKAYMRSIIVANGFNEEFVDKELHKLVIQDEDKALKLRSIDSFNKLTGRLSDKLEVTGSISLLELHKNSNDG